MKFTLNRDLFLIIIEDKEEYVITKSKINYEEEPYLILKDDFGKSLHKHKGDNIPTVFHRQIIGATFRLGDLPTFELPKREPKPLLEEAIKYHLKSLDNPENKLYHNHSLIIDGCFTKCLEIIQDYKNLGLIKEEPDNLYNTIKEIEIEDQSICTTKKEDYIYTDSTGSNIKFKYIPKIKDNKLTVISVYYSV